MTDTYQILVYDSALDLEKAVNEWMGKGWVASGNLVMSAAVQPATQDVSTYPHIELWFAQVMIKLPEAINFTKAQVVGASLAHSDN